MPTNMMAPDADAHATRQTAVEVIPQRRRCLGLCELDRLQGPLASVVLRLAAHRESLQLPTKRVVYPDAPHGLCNTSRFAARGAAEILEHVRGE